MEKTIVGRFSQAVSVTNLSWTIPSPRLLQPVPGVFSTLCGWPVPKRLVCLTFPFRACPRLVTCSAMPYQWYSARLLPLGFVLIGLASVCTCSACSDWCKAHSLVAYVSLPYCIRPFPSLGICPAFPQGADTLARPHFCIVWFVLQTLFHLQSNHKLRRWFSKCSRFQNPYAVASIHNCMPAVSCVAL